MKGPRRARMPVYGAGSKYLGRTQKETGWLRFHAPQRPAIPIAPLQLLELAGTAAAPRRDHLLQLRVTRDGESASSKRRDRSSPQVRMASIGSIHEARTAG
jgi:hypothetical protein